LVLAKTFVEVAAPLRVRERGCFVHDRLGLVLEHGLAHRARVEQIEHDRLRAERPQTFSTRRRVVAADHLVAGIDQLWHEAAANRTACPCDEDSHRVLLSAWSSSDYQGTALR
jgi:hypothetical protein